MQSSGNLAVDPIVNFGGAKSPEFPYVNSSNTTEPCESLESFRMYFHDRCSLIRVEQRFEMKCTAYSRAAIVRAYATRRFFGWEIVTGEQEGLLRHG
jgi:hypothetical protein